MLGETELEDWDEENKPLVLYNYLSIQNGSIIYLTVLTEGIHIISVRQLLHLQKETFVLI